MKYSSAIDTLYTILIVFVGIIGIIVSDFFFLIGYWYVSLIVVAIFAFLYYIFFATSIELKDDYLQINLGFIKKRIKYSDIKEIKRTKNSISSFATSRKRIGIRIGDKTGIFNYTYFSPQKEDEFLNNLKQKLGEDVLINE